MTSALAALVDAAPAALDTLNELAAALGDDASFSTTITNSIASKQSQLNGTGLVRMSGTSVSYDNTTYLVSNFGNIEGEHSYGYPSSDGWYKIAEVVFNGSCQSYNLWGEYRDTGYFDNSHYRIHITARAECDFPTNNESHAINVNMYGSSTNETYFNNNVRVVLTSSSSNYRKYELQYYRATWDTGSWNLQTLGWTTYTTSQTAGTPTGTPRVYYISKFVADNIYAANKISIGTTYSGFAANIAGTTYVIGASVWVNDGYGISNASSGGTGFFPYSDGTLVFNSVNSEKMRIAPSGNVGIGTNSPSALLDVNGRVIVGGGLNGNAFSIATSIGTYTFNNYNLNTPSSFLITAGSSGYLSLDGYPIIFKVLGSETMRVHTSGNIGIGTDSPTHLLSLSRATQAAAYQLNINNAGGISDGNFTGIRFSQDSNAATELGNIKLHYYSTGATDLSFGTRYSPTALYIQSGGNVGIGTTGPEAKLHIVSGASQAGFLSRGTNGDTWFPYSNGQNYVRGVTNFDSGSVYFTGGNIGIGTTSPSHKLHIKSSSLNSYPLVVQRAANTNNIFYIYEDGSGNGTLTLENSGGGAAVSIKSDGTSYLNGGNVGIGTTSPSSALEVIGTIRNKNASANSNYSQLSTTEATLTLSTYSINTTSYPANIIFSPASTEAMRINTAGKVSIGTTDTNSDKSDFTVYTGSGASLALVDDQVRMGSTDVNWGVALRSTGYLETYGQALYLQSLAGNHPVVVRPNNTSSVEFYQDYTLFNGLNLSISRINSAHAANYFRGDTSHLVIGTGGTLYLNYGGNTTNITGNTTNSGWLGVTGIVSANARKLSLGILDLNSGITPAQYKIKTNIPWNYGGSDFTVNIKGFRYGVGQMVSLSIGWHYYNNEFYNRNAISNGAWAPTISLAKSPDGYVIIYIPGPDYWPKLYVESVYSSNSADAYTTGWSWTDANLSDCTLIQTVPYKDLATNISGNAATATSATTAGALSSMNISQFTNNSGYITGYTETDTLASVTNRGNSTTDRINVRGAGNQGGGNIMMGNIGEGTSKWSYLTSTHYNASSQPQGFALIGGLATSGGNAVVIGGNIYETNPATEIQFWTHGTNTHNLGGTQRGVINSSGNWGIGTTNPGDYKLYVNGGQFGTLLRGGDLGTGSDVVRMIKSDGSAAMLVRGDGKVGIGTLSPSEEFHVSGRAIFDGGSGNSSTDAVVYITKSNNNDWGLYVNAAALDYGMYTRVSPSAGYAIGVNNGTNWTTRITGDGRIYLSEKDTIASYDTWLRLNESGHYGSGVYTPGVMRADGGFYVSGSQVWHAGNDGSGSGLDADTVDGVQASSLLRSDIYNSNYGGLQVFRNIGTIDGSWEDSSHTFSLENGDAGNIVLNFHRAGYTSNNLWYNGSKFRFDAALESTGVITATGGNSTNWNTAYSWGNHASYSYATTSYVTTQINNLINGAPGVLDTLDELAAALGDDSNFATTVTNSIATKLPLAGGTMSGTISFVNNIGTALQGTVGINDYWRIYANSTTTNAGYLEIATSDDGTEPIYVRQYTGVFSSLTRTATLLDGAGNTAFPGNLNIGGFLTESSSLKLKENVKTSEGNLEKVVNLRPVTYNKIGSQTTELGLIAEEVAEVYPEFVQYDESGEPIGVNYSRLTAALIGAVKELTNQVQELNKKING